MTWQRIATSAALQLRRGDWNAFTMLGTYNLAKTAILPTILTGTFRLAPEIIFANPILTCQACADYMVAEEGKAAAAVP